MCAMDLDRMIIRHEVYLMDAQYDLEIWMAWVRRYDVKLLLTLQNLQYIHVCVLYYNNSTL